MRDVTFSDIERLGAATEAEETFHMDEDAFRLFYERTARTGVGVSVAHDR